METNEGRGRPDYRDDGGGAATTADPACDAGDRFDAMTLSRIEQALARMDRGSYGYCVACGSAIDLARLEADPAEHACAACD